MKSDERRLNASEEQRLSANGNQVAVNKETKTNRIAAKTRN